MLMNRAHIRNGMCDCYEEEFEEVALETSEPAPVVVPLLVAKSRKK